MPCDIFIVYHQIGQNASRYFQTRAAFPAVFFFLPYPKNKQRVRSYLTKSPKNRKQTIKLFLIFYKQG
nr:MAG TPA: hypothetical protein [Caudoviricetes sp.]